MPCIENREGVPGSERGDRVRRGKGGVSRGAGAAQARGRGGEWSIGELAAMDEPKGHPGAGLVAQRAGAAGGAGSLCMLWFNIADVAALS